MNVARPFKAGKRVRAHCPRRVSDDWLCGTACRHSIARPLKDLLKCPNSSPQASRRAKVPSFRQRILTVPGSLHH